MANYIQKLNTVRLDLTDAIVDAKNALDEITSYLYSTKFHNDTTVQVKDVLDRLLPVRGALLDGLHKADAFRTPAPKRVYQVTDGNNEHASGVFNTLAAARRYARKSVWCVESYILWYSESDGDPKWRVLFND
jgi:hypothetical protein